MSKGIIYNKIYTLNKTTKKGIQLQYYNTQ